MLSLVRSGPTILKIRASGDAAELIDAITNMSSERDDSDLNRSYNLAGEGDTLIFIDSGNSDDLHHYQTSSASSAVLCDLINRKLAGSIQHVSMTPPNIVMRLIGNLDAAIDQIAADFKARETTSAYLIQNIDESSVLVNFTAEPINRAVPYAMMHKRALLIDKPYGPLVVFLRAKAQEYLNLAMGSPDWNEIEITMFDAMDQFNLHYNRLITVLQGLDIGIVIGEAWVPEYTIAMRKSEVYQVRLLTPISAQEIKRMALALEYDDDGRRVVDFDVYFKKRKLGWSSELKQNKGYTRDEIGVLHRKRLLSSLPAEAKAMLQKLDLQIDKSGPLKG
ncbi:MAG: hypothetical protein LBQ58_11015 [Synergistaceae bacterium]|jgi:hypothetical protein|nr:hypothetical protein [Synergistaceae bacterium]